MVRAPAIFSWSEEQREGRSVPLNHRLTNNELTLEVPVEISRCVPDCYLHRSFHDPRAKQRVGFCACCATSRRFFSFLQIGTSSSVPFTGWVAGKARCDDDGNIYIHLMSAEMRQRYLRASRSPVTRIKPDGSLGGAFRITDAESDGADFSARDFFVKGNGEVYLPATSNSDAAVYVVAFSKDGSVRSKIKVDAAFFLPYQIVVFPSGEFLLSGTTGPEDRIAFTGVFDSSGKLIRRISEPEDEDFRQKAEAHDPNFESKYTNSGNTSVWHGDAALGSDGNAYLLRAASPALVYAISSKGKIISKLRIDSPGSGLVAQEVRPAKGKLAIIFREPYSTLGMVRVVDYQGNPIATYSSDDKVIYPGIAGCYSSTSFVSEDDQGNVHLYKADQR